MLNAKRISEREKLILSGLFFSKYDAAGLRALGFQSFVEAFNAIGFALGAKPASLKNYRDEFDPLFAHRKGWHKRPRRDYCMRVFESYNSLDFETFSALIQSFFADRPHVIEEEQARPMDRETSFAKRVITGLAAERYFESVVQQLKEFSRYSVENTTLLGCGYDFQLTDPGNSQFLVVEVKGMSAAKGGIALTEKEHKVASQLKERFYLFVVKNFIESPFHELYQNPLSGILQFEKKERVIVNHSWVTAL